MPTYEYECTQCGDRFDKEQRFSDEPLTSCVKCQGTLRKVYSAVGVVFKGSGFYKNDSRSTPSESKSAKTPESTSESTATASAPVPTPAATPSAPSPAASSSAPSSSSD